ncbi:lysylphosphatidylglycerol synthase domain-containing protein [Streptomyces glomeratus]|nr:lysylphosphatidylglycerol synthase domain-containing protein [Streptomyces glomeratus]
MRVLRSQLGTVAGAAILGVLLWRLGTGVFLDGLRRIDAPTLLAGLGIGVLTTVFSAWRWCRVARALDIRLPLGAAVADYYRALFLNAALPGGVLGDVHRAVRHGQSAGDVGRGVRAVVLERTAGQVALVVIGVPVLLTMPSPVLAQARHLAGLLALGALGALAVVAAVRMGRAPRPSRRTRALAAALAEARTALLARGSLPAVLLSSAVVLAGHLLMFLVAARAAGSHASPATLLPLALLALIAMGLPLNVGGWGPREGVTAWAFGAAGLGAETGLSVAVVYGVLSFVASLPGIVVLLARWYGGLRGPRATAEAQPAGDGAKGPSEAEEASSEAEEAPTEAPSGPSEASKGSPDRGPERTPHTLRAPVPYAPYPRSPPGPRTPLLTRCQAGRGSPESVVPGRPPAGSSEVTREKYAAKEPASVASSCFPFSAEASEGRPMTPDSV